MMAAVAAENNQQADFPTDQAAILQDLARNGAATEGNIFPSGESQHPNGQTNSSNDLDPAALLESLANFEHPVNENPTPVSNDHFASLLQAAATAGGQEARENQYSGFESPARDAAPQPDGEDEQRRFGFVNTRITRRKARGSSDDAEDARVREIWGPEEAEEEIFEYEQDGPLRSGNKGNGIHSVAALFRRPSAASKKYTRPTMSKMFTSLDLSPEKFLSLQAVAKEYMLDPEHPERPNCVAIKGQPDTDMVKLKLFGCVQTFLEDEGWGEKYFGLSAEGGENRKLKWPQMKHRIITLCMPILRRMVTNERQRQYAVEARKKQSKEKKVKGPSQEAEKLDEVGRDVRSPSPFPEIDPKLKQYHYDVETSFTDGQARGQEAVSNERSEVDDMKFLVNILQNGSRIKPKAVLTPTNCPGFPSLMTYVHGLVHGLIDETRTPLTVKVLGPSGLVTVGNDATWNDVVRCVRECDWMDREMKCIVELD